MDSFNKDIFLLMLHYLEKNHLLHQPATLCFAHEDSAVILVLQCIIKVRLNVLIIIRLTFMALQFLLFSRRDISHLLPKKIDSLASALVVLDCFERLSLLLNTSITNELLIIQFLIPIGFSSSSWWALSQRIWTFLTAPSAARFLLRLVALPCLTHPCYLSSSLWN